MAKSLRRVRIAGPRLASNSERGQRFPLGKPAASRSVPGLIPPTTRVAADMLAFSKFWDYVRLHAEPVVLCPGKGQVSRVEHEFGFDGLPFRVQSVLPELVEGFLDAPGGKVLPPSLFEHPAAELSVDDSAQLGEDRRQPDHIA